MKTLNILIISQVLFAGCATIAGHGSRATSVDSIPRGLTVQSLNTGKTLGKTPFFTELNASSQIQLQLEGSSSPKSVKCPYDWTMGFFSNIPFGLITIPFFGAGFPLAAGIDLGTGAAFRCPNNIILHSLNARGEDRCRKYLIVPPKNYDEKVANELVKLWIIKSQQNLQPCDSVVEPSETNSLFKRFVRSAEKEDLLNKKNRDKLNTLGLRTGASHIVFLESEIKEGSARLIPHVVDMHSEVVVESYSPPMEIAEIERYEAENKSIFTYVNLLPNSIAFGSTSRDFDDTPPKGFDSVEVTQQSKLPKYISNVKILSVDNPLQFDPWDLTLSFYPSISTSFMLADVKSTQGGISQNNEIQFFYLSVPYEFGPTVHTPLGALSLSIGLGPMFTYFTDSDDNTAANMTGIFTTRFAYTAFMSENVFMRFEYFQQMTLFEPFIDRTYMRPSSLMEGALVIGYYFPEGRSALRQIF